MLARAVTLAARVQALPQLRGLIIASDSHAMHKVKKTLCWSPRRTRPPWSGLQVAIVRTPGRRCIVTASSEIPLHFDTHHVVKSLQEKGFSVAQSEAILDVMKDAMADSLVAQARILATKSEHVELKAELSERVFNSTLKFDIAQRHSRELLERDFNTLKQDIRMLEKIDFDKIRMEIAELEKKFLLQKQAEDETLNELRLSMEKVEKRMLQYAVGFAGTIMAVGAALMRLVL